MSDFEDRLGEWMRRHPVRQPRDVDPSAFIESVMGRVRREPRPGRVTEGWTTWLAWPRLALGAVVAVAVLAFLVVTEPPLTVAVVEPPVVVTPSPARTSPADVPSAEEEGQIRALRVQAYVLAALDELDTDVVPLTEEDLVDELVELEQLAPTAEDEDDVESLGRELRVLDELGES